MSQNPHVPTNVPGNVPSSDTAISALSCQLGDQALPRSLAAINRAPTYLSGSPAGWRFQMRLPIRFSTCDSKKNRGQFLKKHLGPGSKRDAIEKARRLAFIATSIFQYLELLMLDSTEPQSGTQDSADGDLLARVIAACKTGIDRALVEPHYAITFAADLQASLQALTSVGSVIANPTANPALHAASPAIVADALTSILKASGDAAAKVATSEAADLLSSENSASGSLVASPISPGPVNAAPSAPEIAPSQEKDTSAALSANDGDKIRFSDIAALYIDTRAMAGASDKDLGALKLKARTFVEVVGDRAINEYNPIDLQSYVNAMQHRVTNATQRKEFAGLTVKEILDKNKNFAFGTISKKTLQDGYVATIRSMINFDSQFKRFNNPFAGPQLRYPKMLKASVARESLSGAILSAIFANGVSSGHLGEAVLPLLGFVTSRRLSLLVHLRGSDIRQKDGVWIAQVNNVAEVEGTLTRVPAKTEASTRYFVLHAFLEEIGFIDWARSRPGWVFEELHEHPDPGDYASKMMSRLFKASGAIGENREVFHSLRHMSIDDKRDTDLEPRDQKLQSDHSLGSDEHEKYGSTTIKMSAACKIRDADLPADIDFSVFYGLDFGALAAARRSRSAPKRKGGTK